MDKANAVKGSAKRLLIDRANATMLAFIGAASFVVVFSLVGSKALLDQSSYQSKVIKEKEQTLKQLKTNNSNVTSLVSSYESFANEKVNVLDGNPAGAGPKDGDNPKIVLDALPSKYDYPGLISSLEKVMKDGNYQVTSLNGADDELAQQAAAASGATSPVQMPFSLTVKTSYDGAQLLLKTFEKSIRPIYVNKIAISAGASGDITETIDALTYYQPEKPLKITTKVVK